MHVVGFVVGWVPGSRFLDLVSSLLIMHSSPVEHCFAYPLMFWQEVHNEAPIALSSIFLIMSARWSLGRRAWIESMLGECCCKVNTAKNKTVSGCLRQKACSQHIREGLKTSNMKQCWADSSANDGQTMGQSACGNTIATGKITDQINSSGELFGDR